MSDTVAFIPKRPISYEEYASVIRELGGSPTLPPYSSSIASGEANVYLIFGSDMSDADYSPEQMQELTDFLGIPPPLWISVTIGHGPGSYELASRVLAQFDRRFGCIIDDFGIGTSIQGEKMVWKKEHYE